MKNPLILVSALTLCVCCNAQIRPEEHSWRATLNVVDDEHKPVGGAETWVSFSSASPSGEPIPDKIAGVTDANGVFSASHTDRSVYLGFHAQKEGYYGTWTQHKLGFSVDDRTVNWNPTQQLVLKRILHPIAMYANWVNLAIPKFDKPIGFDLFAGDWVEPYGKGITTDIIFTAHLDKRAEDNFDYKVVVTFPKPGDGIQQFTVPEAEKASPLRSPYGAPENDYKPQWIKEQSRRPGDPARHVMDENLNFFFRVRTTLDQNGNVTSALYGKIYGDFLHFRYYLNPMPNDRNVEFDPKKNLLKGLQGSHVVDVP